MNLRRILLGSVLLFNLSGPLWAGSGQAAPGGELLAASGVFNVLHGSRQWLASAEYRLDAQKWNLRPWLGVAALENTTWYFSAGLLYRVPLPDGWRFSIGFAPSYYTTRAGKWLGEHLEFYSFGEVGFAFRNGHALNLRFGHLSNAHLASVNPGAEILQLGYSIPLPW